jgi:hypothetical protein
MFRQYCRVFIIIIIIIISISIIWNLTTAMCNETNKCPSHTTLQPQSQLRVSAHIKSPEVSTQFYMEKNFQSTHLIYYQN